MKYSNPFSHYTQDTLCILGGIICATVGLEGFIVPNGLLDGGVTGISLMLAKIFNLDVSVFIFLINIPFIILGLREVSKEFAIKTLCAIILLSLVLWLLHSWQFPNITQDRLLIAVFGGFFLGAGIGLAMRGGSVIDGTEVLALYLSKKTSLQVAEIILVINVVIFMVAAALYGIENALYSILTYMAASKTIDFLTNGIEEYTGVIIISEHSFEIRKTIVSELGRGVTILNGKRGLRGKRANIEGLNDREVLYTVVTKLELTRLRNIIEEIDDTSFITTHSITSVKGGMVKARKLH